MLIFLCIVIFKYVRSAAYIWNLFTFTSINKIFEIADRFMNYIIQ